MELPLSFSIDHNLTLGRVEEAAEIVRTLKHELRIPTLTWLFSDMFGILDIDARDLINELIQKGVVRRTSGGWIEVLK